MKLLSLLTLAIPFASVLAQTPDVFVVDDFETQSWEGVERSQARVKHGQFSGKWAEVRTQSSVRAEDVPTDWSSYDRLVFWLYSERDNGQGITIVCDSENDESEGWDYFACHLKADWQGWKLINLRLYGDMAPARDPIGWHQINELSIRVDGWGHKPLPDTVLFFDDVKLVRDPVALRATKRQAEQMADGSRKVTFRLDVTNRSDRPRRFELVARREVSGDPSAMAYHMVGLPRRTAEISPGKTRSLRVALTATPVDLAHCEPLAREEFIIEMAPGPGDLPGPQVSLVATTPIPRREHPFLFADSGTLERAKSRAEKYDWAKKQFNSIIRSADDVLDRDLVVPDEPGQWSHHYVCKECGARLRHEGDKHVCSRCGAEYTGWPYDQVVIAGVHGGNWRNIRTLGLAYALGGEEAYAGKAREILLAYADTYLTYPLHNVRGKESASAGRVFAQTLDESVAIIGVAWGYDLIYNSPCLSATDREKIESDFLRQVVEVIRRHDAGISNWQSWHNAGIAAVGFCLQDDELASLAINGKSGLRFQFANSVLGDGFWYEGAAAYHYYALDALRWTVEAARGAGIDFTKNAAYKSLYDAPLLYVFPDFKFPAVNDSGSFSISGRHGLYELAYARFGDPDYLAVTEHGDRGCLEAFLWGVDELPETPELALESREFEGLGAAVLRQGMGEDQMYVHLDYGPHGGGHGHPDKLAIILFALGRQLAPDPGSLSYGAPLHGSWYRQTFAHNTVCVDERSQERAEGKLTIFDSEPGFAIAQAECDSAYPGVMMRRTLALTEGYLIDVLSVRSEDVHTYDWLYHNFGALTPGLATTPREQPLATANGYQHMTDISEAQTAGNWFADFKQDGASVRLTMLGAPDTHVYFGTGMSGNPPEPCPMVAVRRRGKEATFVSVVEPYRDKPSVLHLKSVRVRRGQKAIALEISREHGRDLFMIAEQAGIRRELGGIGTTARVCFVRKTGDEPVQIHEVE